MWSAPAEPLVDESLGSDIVNRMKANAVVFTGPGRVEYLPVECPEPGANDVVVHVTHSWISNGTEGSFLRGERIAGDTAFRIGDPIPFPIVAGYQKIGVIESVGDEVTGFASGDLVFCTMSKVGGMFEPRGGHVSPAVTDASQVWKIPSELEIDPVAFSGLVLTQVGYNCGARPQIAPGDTAVVVGDGMVGQWAAQTLAWRGARVVLSGRHPNRLDRFKAGFGRTTVDATRSDLSAYLTEHVPSGARVLIDTIGSIPTIDELSHHIIRFGHIVSAGFYGTEDLLPLQSYRDTELSIDLVSGWTSRRIDLTLELVAQGHLDTLGLITHRFPVNKAATAWEYIREKREDALGVILEWE